MPYIDQSARDKIIETNDRFDNGDLYTSINVDNIITPGEMNYAITAIILNYLDRKGINYTNMNEVIGVLECAKLELYRRMVTPYENKKIEEHGDVYD